MTVNDFDPADFYERLDDLLDRRVAPESDPEFVAALARNPQWQTLWQAEQALFAGLRATHDLASSPNLTDRILAELAAGPVSVAESTPAKRSRWGLVALCGTLAAAVLVVLVPALRNGGPAAAPVGQTIAAQTQLPQLNKPENRLATMPAGAVPDATVPLSDLLREAQTRTYALASETQSEWSELAVLIPQVAVPSTGNTMTGNATSDEPDNGPQWLKGMQRPLEPFQNRVQSAFDYLLDTPPSPNDRAAS